MSNINEAYIHALKKCIEIREVEQFISKHYPEQIFRCPVHLAIGHEAIPSALMSCHKSNRSIFSYHRSHHHFLSSGASLESLLFELNGSPQGACAGFGGSHHLRDEKNGFMGSTPIITGTLPVATGFAHGQKLNHTNHRTFVFMGDTCGEEGLFYESLNCASLYQLPITFVIEDNELSCFTPTEQRHGFKSYQGAADHFGIPYFATKGDSLLSVLKTSNSHYDHCQRSQGPTLFYANVYRPYEHCGYQIEDKVEYREIDHSWPKRDPIHNALQDALELNISKEVMTNLILETQQVVQKRCDQLLTQLRESLKGVQAQ